MALCVALMPDPSADMIGVHRVSQEALGCCRTQERLWQLLAKQSRQHTRHQQCCWKQVRAQKQGCHSTPRLLLRRCVGDVLGLRLCVKNVVGHGRHASMPISSTQAASLQAAQILPLLHRLLLPLWPDPSRLRSSCPGLGLPLVAGSSSSKESLGERSSAC